jgi:hypothetical protein
MVATNHVGKGFGAVGAHSTLHRKCGVSVLADSGRRKLIMNKLNNIDMMMRVFCDNCFSSRQINQMPLALGPMITVAEIANKFGSTGGFSNMAEEMAGDQLVLNDELCAS